MPQILISVDDGGNVTMLLGGVEPADGAALLIEGAMQLTAQYNLADECGCPPGTHGPAKDAAENTQLVMPPNDFVGLATSLRRAQELEEEKVRHD